MHTIAVTMRMTPSGTRTPIKMIDVLSIKQQAGKNSDYTSLAYMVSFLSIKEYSMFTFTYPGLSHPQWGL